MNITKTPAHILTITDAPRLDPVRVILQDEAYGAGSIIITCYGTAWTAFWSGMSGRTVAQFFVDSHPDYLLGKLIHGKASKSHENYTLRVIEAVQAALIAQAKELPSFNHDNAWRDAVEGK